MTPGPSWRRLWLAPIKRHSVRQAARPRRWNVGFRGLIPISPNIGSKVSDASGKRLDPGHTARRRRWVRCSFRPGCGRPRQGMRDDRCGRPPRAPSDLGGRPLRPGGAVVRRGRPAHLVLVQGRRAPDRHSDTRTRTNAGTRRPAFRALRDDGCARRDARPVRRAGSRDVGAAGAEVRPWR
jgi:hypothetical protein